MMQVALDSSILISLIYGHAPTRQGQAEALLGRLSHRPRPPLLVWPVVEAVAARLAAWQAEGVLDVQQVRHHWEQLRAAMPYLPPSMAAVERAFALAAEHRLAFDDALLIACCLEGDVVMLYTERPLQVRKFDSLRLVNPFAPRA